MAINPEAVGTSRVVEARWGPDECLLYALGVGAGSVDPLRPAELQFTTENSEGVPQRVLPTFPVVVANAEVDLLGEAGDLDWTMLVHAEQSVSLHREVPVEGAVRTTTTITGIYDKGSGALISMAGEARDVSTGEPMWITRSSAFVRGAGGWGGDRGPSVPRFEPPDREPDFEVALPTRVDQALLYRLSGDRNALHSDPAFARRAGFERPILHGLCTYGFTGRALLDVLCDGDPSRFRSMTCRFTSPVLPGDTLTVRMWVDGDEVVFRTSARQGDVVLDAGRCTFTT